MIKRPVITSGCRLKQTLDDTRGRVSSIDEQEEGSAPLISSTSNMTHHLSISIPMETETRVEVPSPDYTFIARHLRAIVLNTDQELTLCEDVEIDGRSLAVQKDGESCSIFTIDNIFHMSKLPELHDHVNQYRVKDPSYEDKPIYCLDPRDLPAMLVKNAQSDRFMRRWMERNTDKLDVAVDKKGHNIRDYVRIHSIFYPTIKKEINAGLQEKQIKYASRLKQFH